MTYSFLFWKFFGKISVCLLFFFLSRPPTFSSFFLSRQSSLERTLLREIATPLVNVERSSFEGGNIDFWFESLSAHFYFFAPQLWAPCGQPCERKPLSLGLSKTLPRVTPWLQVPNGIDPFPISCLCPLVTFPPTLSLFFIPHEFYVSVSGKHKMQSKHVLFLSPSLN